MSSYLLSAHAENDLVGIFQYTEKEWGRSQATAYLHEVYAGFQHLVDFPEAGRARPEVAEHIRSWRVGRHVVFYTLRKKIIYVVRVMHGTSDFSNVFERDA